MGSSPPSTLPTPHHLPTHPPQYNFWSTPADKKLDDWFYRHVNCIGHLRVEKIIKKTKNLYEQVMKKVMNLNKWWKRCST